MYTTQLGADYKYCESIIKKYSKSFYYAFSGLPTKKANAVYTIYAFCRIADDCVDEQTGPKNKLKELNQLRHELTLFEKEQELDHPLWRALRHVFNEFEMEIQPFYDQITGQAMDIHFKAPQNREALEDYSYYVAGSVGLMLLPIIASHSAHALYQPAIDLGIAMQITNILRDIGEDYYDKQRIYLPQDELERVGYSKEALHEGVINESFIELWELLATRAEELYDKFSNHIEKFDVDSQMPVSLSANVYRGILDAVRDNNYDCLSQRNYVSNEKMNQIGKVTNNIS